MLGLRSFAFVPDGHCCVYSIAHQLGVPRYDPAASGFKISRSECLRLRTEAHSLLTSASDFVSRCLWTFGITTLLR